MRRTLQTLLLGTLLTTMTCGRLDVITVRESTTSVVQRGTLLERLVGDTGLPSFLGLKISQSQEMENQGVEAHQIDSMTLHSLTLEITDDPLDGRDFTFIEFVEFFVEADGLERRLIASGGPFPEGLTTIGMDVEPIDIAPYTTAPSMDITTRVTGWRPDQTTTIESEIVLRVDVNLGGAICGG